MSAQHMKSEHTAERLFEIVEGEYLFGRTTGQYCAINEHYMVAKLRHATKVVGRHQHYPALVSQAAH